MIREYIYQRFLEVTDAEIKDPESPIRHYFNRRSGTASAYKKNLSKAEFEKKSPIDKKMWAPSSSFEISGGHRRSARAPGGPKFLPHEDARALDKELTISHLAHRMSVHDPRVVYGHHVLKDYAIDPRSDEQLEKAFFKFIHTRQHTHMPLAKGGPNEGEKWGPDAKYTTLTHLDKEEVLQSARQRAEDMKAHRIEREGKKKGTPAPETPVKEAPPKSAHHEAPPSPPKETPHVPGEGIKASPGWLKKHWKHLGIAAGVAGLGAFGIHKYRQHKQKKEQEEAEQAYLDAINQYAGE